jgi:hypothetical protein
MMVQRSASRLYLLMLNIASLACLTARDTELSWHWHGIYEYIGFQGLKKLAQGAMVRRLPSIVLMDQAYEGCLEGKQHQNAFPVAATFRAMRALDLDHVQVQVAGATGHEG